MSTNHKVNRFDHRLEGIRGWLICPAVGLIVTLPFVTMEMLMENSMTSKYFGAYAIPRLFVNIGLLIYTLITAVKFFKKQRNAVRAIIILLIARVIAALVFFLIGIIVMGGANRELIISLLSSNNFVYYGIAAAIWVPYFIVSKRVKATFVN